MLRVEAITEPRYTSCDLVESNTLLASVYRRAREVSNAFERIKSSGNEVIRVE